MTFARNMETVKAAFKHIQENYLLAPERAWLLDHDSSAGHVGLSPSFEIPWDRSASLHVRLGEYLELLNTMPKEKDAAEVASPMYAQITRLIKQNLLIDGKLNTKLADYFDSLGYHVYMIRPAGDRANGRLIIDFQAGRLVWTLQ